MLHSYVWHKKGRGKKEFYVRKKRRDRMIRITHEKDGEIRENGKMSHAYKRTFVIRRQAEKFL